MLLTDCLYQNKDKVSNQNVFGTLKYPYYESKIRSVIKCHIFSLPNIDNKYF